MQSMAAIDYFVPTYNVWGRIIQELSDLGYDPQKDLVCVRVCVGVTTAYPGYELYVNFMMMHLQHN